MALHSNHFTVYVALNNFILLLCDWTLPAAGSGISSASGLLQAYDHLYYSGVRAYFAEEWEKAAELLEKSIATKDALVRVRRQCHGECIKAGQQDTFNKLGTSLVCIVVTVFVCAQSY